MQDQRFPKSPETIPQRLAFAEVVFDRRAEAAVAGALPLRAATSHQSRAFDPCRGIPHPGASLRRTQAIDPKTADSSGQRRAHQDGR